MRKIIALGALIVLGGCAQNYGVTHVSATFSPDGHVSGFDWATGTEKAHVKVIANVNTGQVEYQADDVKAFDGQRIAGDIYAGLTAAGVNVTEAIVRGVVTGVLGTSAIQGVGTLGAGVVKSNAALEAAKLKAGAQ